MMTYGGAHLEPKTKKRARSDEEERPLDPLPPPVDFFPVSTLLTEILPQVPLEILAIIMYYMPDEPFTLVDHPIPKEALLTCPEDFRDTKLRQDYESSAWVWCMPKATRVKLRDLQAYVRQAHPRHVARFLVSLLRASLAQRPGPPMGIFDLDVDRLIGQCQLMEWWRLSELGDEVLGDLGGMTMVVAGNGL